MKVIEVQLQDGRVLQVHEPRTGEMAAFMRALPVFIEITKRVAPAGAQESQPASLLLDGLSDELLDGLWSVIALMTGLTLAEVKDLPMWDGLGLIQAFGELMPKNFLSPKPISPPISAGSVAESVPLPSPISA